MANLNYSRQGFQDGDTLSADNLIKIENAIIDNQETIIDITEEIINIADEVEKRPTEEEMADAIQIAVDNVNVEDQLKNYVEKSSLPNTFGQYIYYENNEIKTIPTSSTGTSIPSAQDGAENIDYYIGKSGEYSHYRKINGVFEQIGSSAKGKIYRITYGKISLDEPPIAGKTDEEMGYLLRLWEIDEKDFNPNNPPPFTSSVWTTVFSEVVGKETERSIIDAYITKNNISSILSKDITDDTKIYLEFFVRSTNQQGTNDYGFSYSISINNTTIRTKKLASQVGGQTIQTDITKYVNPGNNVFNIIITDDKNNTEYLQHQINCIVFTANASFQENRTYSPLEETYVEYTVQGDNFKKISYLEIYDKNNKLIERVSRETSALIKQDTFNLYIPTGLEHGKYLLKCYSRSTTYGDTNALYFDMLVVEEGGAPLIGCSKRGEQISIGQYNQIIIPYFIYNNDLLEPNLTKQVYYSELGFESAQLIFTEALDRTEREDNWRYRFKQQGYYILELSTSQKIDGLLEKKDIVQIKIRVEQLELAAKVRDTIENRVVLDFDPSERKTFSLNKETQLQQLKIGECYSRDGDSKIATEKKQPIHMIASDNFDWISGGYQIDSNNRDCFVIKANTSITINYPLFGVAYQQPKAEGLSLSQSGRTIQLYFKTDKIYDSDKSFLECKEGTGNSTRGLIMYPQKAVFRDGGSQKLELPYSENDLIEFGLALSKAPTSGAKKENNDQDEIQKSIVYGYEDGVSTKPLVGFNHTTLTNEQPIVIGSEGCDIIIYKIKVHDTYLKDEDILTEFILNASNGEEMQNRDRRNNFDFETSIDDNNISEYFDEMSEKYPDLRFILVQAEKFTTSKDDKVEGTTITQWYGNGRAEDNWVATGAMHRGQGTSSNDYYRSGKNLDIDLTKATVKYRGKEEEIENLSLSKNSINNKYFNIKLNIASSENANNALLQKKYNEFNPYDRPFTEEQKQNSIDEDGNPITILPKDTMEFYNCVVYVQEKGPASNNTEYYDSFDVNSGSWKYTEDNKVHFYGIGNIGDSKKTDDTRLTDKNDPFECIMEIFEVYTPLSDFPLLEEKWKDGESAKDKLESETFDKSISYEWRYIYEDGKVLIRDLKNESDRRYAISVFYGSNPTSEQEEEVLNKTVGEVCKQLWINAYKAVTAVKKPIEKIEEINSNYVVTYQDGSIETYADLISMRVGTMPDNWGSNYLEPHFVLSSVLFYTVFTTRYTMVDNRAKNSFWHFGKCDNQGNRKWDLSFDYDNDTALGIDNQGQMVFRYGYEDQDLADEGALNVRDYVFREADSTFFCRLKKSYTEAVVVGMETLSSIYNTIGTSKWKSDVLIEEFDNWQNLFPERLWKADIRKKYISSYRKSSERPVSEEKVSSEKFLTDMACGRKKYQRRQFERNQHQYMGILYKGADMPMIYARSAAGATNGQVQVTMKPNSYLGYGASEKEMDQTRITKENYEDKHNINFYGDIFRIWGAPWISSISGLQGKINGTDELGLTGLGEINLSSLNKITTLYITNNKSLTKLTLPGEGPLSYLNFTGSTALSSNELYFSNSNDSNFSCLPELETLLAKDTNISEYKFRDGGPLNTLCLSDAATLLDLPNQYSLEVLDCANSKLADIIIVNGSLLPKRGEEPTVKNSLDNNASFITGQDILRDALTHVREDGSKVLTNVDIRGIDWLLNDSEGYDLIEQLYLLSNTPGKYVNLSGNIEFEVLDGISWDNYKNTWPNLTITVKSLIEKYKVVFKNFDGTILLEKTVTSGPIYDPTKNASLTEKGLTEGQKPLIETPQRKQDKQASYKFTKWSPNISEENGYYISTNSLKEFTATYEATPRKYQIYWHYNHIKDTEWDHYYEANYGEEVSLEKLGKPEHPSPLYRQVSGSDDFLVFQGWDTNLGCIGQEFSNYPNSTEIHVKGIWEQSQTGSQDFDDKTRLNAADILKYKHKNLLFNSDPNVKDIGYGDRLMIPLGFRPTHTNIEKIDFLEKLNKNDNGSVEIPLSSYIDTGYPLFKEKKDWTLFIDFTYKYIPGETYTTLYEGEEIIEKPGDTLSLLGCWSNYYGGGFGVRVDLSRQAGQLKNEYNSITYGPKIYYGGASQETKVWATKNKATNDNQSLSQSTGNYLTDAASNYSGLPRECLVLRYKANDEKLHCYWNLGFDGKEEYQILSNMRYNINDNLILGATQGPENGIIQNSGVTIHNCVLWKGDLGSLECKKLAYWPWKNLKFDVVNTQGYSVGAQKKTAIDLLCSEMFDKGIQYYYVTDFFEFNNQNQPGIGTEAKLRENVDRIGFTNSRLCYWLNNNFYKAIPIQWQAIMTTPAVPTVECEFNSDYKYKWVNDTGAGYRVRAYDQSGNEISDQRYILKAPMLNNASLKVWIPSYKEFVGFNDSEGTRYIYTRQPINYSGQSTATKGPYRISLPADIASVINSEGINYSNFTTDLAKFRGPGYATNTPYVASLSNYKDIYGNNSSPSYGQYPPKEANTGDIWYGQNSLNMSNLGIYSYRSEEGRWRRGGKTVDQGDYLPCPLLRTQLPFGNVDDRSVIGGLLRLYPTGEAVDSSNAKAWTRYNVIPCISLLDVEV